MNRSFRRVQLLPRIFDHRDRRDFDIGKLAVQLLEAADIDVLNDVPGLGSIMTGPRGLSGFFHP